MSNLTKQWPIIIYLTLLSVIAPRIFGPSETQAAPGASNVIVTNTPLPVSVNGTPTVGIDPSKNRVTLLRDPESPARQPYQVSFECVLDAAFYCNTQSTASGVTVPSGKVLVIEFVSISAGYGATQSNGGNGEAALYVGQSGTVVAHHFPLVPTLEGVARWRVASQQTRLYASPLSQVDLACAFNGIVSGGQCSVSLSGHLVDVP